MANRVAATYSGSGGTHTITWSAPTPGSKLIMLVSSWSSFDMPPGWTQDALFAPWNGMVVLSKTATASDTSVTLTSGDSRLHAIVYERDDCGEVAFVATAESRSSSVTATATVPPGTGRVFAVANLVGGLGTLSWDQGLVTDHTATGSQSNSAFASGAAPAAGSRSFTLSGFASSSNPSGLLVIGYIEVVGGDDGGGGGGQALLRATSQATGTTGSSYTIARPAGVEEGDILVMFHVDAARTDYPSWSISGGGAWNLVGEVDSYNDGSDAATSVWWRRAGASEPSSYTISRVGNAYIGMLAVISGAHPSLTPTWPPYISSTTSGQTSVSSPAGSPTGAGDIELRFVAADPSSTGQRSFSPPSGYTEALDLQVDNRLVAQLVWASMTGSGGTPRLSHQVNGSSVAASNGWTVNIPAAPAAPRRALLVVPGAAAVRAAHW